VYVPIGTFRVVHKNVATGVRPPLPTTVMVAGNAPAVGKPLQVIYILSPKGAVGANWNVNDPAEEHTFISALSTTTPPALIESICAEGGLFWQLITRKVISR
jgi:hypothetical protein